MGMTIDEIRVTGTIRHANDFSPDISASNFAQRDAQEYALDLANCRVSTTRAANPAGIGITGTAAYFLSSVEKIGQIVKTTIVIDLTGLNSGGTAEDIIGADGAGKAHLGQITTAVNGTIVVGKLTCLETPATGDDDINVYSATEDTGVEDVEIVANLTETALCNSGDLVAGTEVALAAPAADQYIYLTGGTGGDATYSAGILMLEFWGKAATDDLDVVEGTFGTSSVSLQTPDLKALGATNNYARFAVTLPPNYVGGETVVLRVSAGMLTTVADTTATLDLVCHQLDEDTTVQADICATAAQSINSLVFADKDFTITATALSAGDVLDCRLVTAVNDGATATVVIACVAVIKLVCDTQG